ncbi:MAG: endonuclease/exonuclease/phosphatase family protein [Verrucomicrobiae bacterium]|nr:endonuclease/exonuclease/phosphatase family protein [Verrucomicrobiae bacterium]
MIKFLVLLGITLSTAAAAIAGTFRVAAYNVENYLDQPTETRHFVKADAAKAKIRETIKAINPDVLALEEMGSTNALLELRDSLKAEGCDFPYWEHVQAYDDSIHAAVLSKLPFTARRPHTNENFLLDGKRFEVKRGFSEVDIAAGTNFTFTLIGAHLKSKLTSPEADEAAQRLEEAKALRRIIDARLTADPQARLIVLGDFNDTRNATSTRAVIGQGKARLIDTRPAERNGDNQPNPNPRYEPRNVTWTHYYGLEDSYARIDYILLSPGLKKYWLPEETYIPVIPNWGIGSDHRPIVAGFKTE